jgi:hypothetical protein
MKLEAQVVREALAGYAAANEVTEAERIVRLARMTPDEARSMYDSLVATWAQARMPQAELRRLDRWRMKTLLDIRRAFEQLARARGLV